MNLSNNNLQSQDVWNDRYEDFHFFVEDRKQPVSRFLLQHMPATPGSCFEIGCFPGRYMALLGEEGWQLNGIDLTPKLPLMQEWMEEEGWNVGTFHTVALENYRSNTEYDLVYSVGFIEHFINYKEVITQHTQFVNQGGKLIITAPNFTGIQGVLHRFFDPVNYRLHYIPSMNLRQWNKVLEREGFRIDTCEPLGTFDFWVDAGQRHGPFKSRLQSHFFRQLPRLKRLLKFRSRFVSPYLGIAATRI